MAHGPLVEGRPSRGWGTDKPKARRAALLGSKEVWDGGEVGRDD